MQELNKWYNKNIEIFSAYREFCDAKNHLIKVKNKNKKIYFLVDVAVSVNEIEAGDCIYNASYNKMITIKNNNLKRKIEQYDCYNQLTEITYTSSTNEWETIGILPGGHLEIGGV